MHLHDRAGTLASQLIMIILLHVTFHSLMFIYSDPFYYASIMLILSVTHYAYNYAGIIGLSLIIKLAMCTVISLKSYKALVKSIVKSTENSKILKSILSW